MRPSLRFLALAVVGWAGFRAATLGALPAGFFSIGRSEAKAPPPIVPTEFPQIEPVEPASPTYAATTALPPPVQSPVQPQAYVGPTVIRYVQGVVGVPVAMRRGVVPVYQLPAAVPAATSDLPPRPHAWRTHCPPPDPVFCAQLPPLGEWPLARIAAMSRPAPPPPRPSRPKVFP